MMSVRAYARQRGVSHVAVLKAIQSGRIPQEPDGTIDPAKANASWEAQSDPAKRPAPSAKQAPKQPANAQSPPPLPAASANQPPPPGMSFAQARTAHEIAKAQRARIQVQRLKSEMVERASAMNLVFKLARQERDAWINWPARVAALMAAQMGIEVSVVQKILETQVRAHLDELSEIRPDFR
ncbi:MAG: elements of external origin [Alphaproteobacteria bacterium]|nr:elements of external origin [Alphaproteobacteria bacterium]